MSSNTSERVATAKIELDKAEEWIFNNPDEFQKELSEFWKKLSEWAKDFADIAKINLAK
ncbi:MAG: hypothetical protein IKI43_04210 [Campylobacter sp.]|nr:hypothetical protein [Campylobacter sp.]MBR7047547.1 hypothetical protein [Campylobacter sp.]